MEGNSAAVDQKKALTEAVATVPTDYSACTDPALVARIQEKCGDAFTELYRRHARAVYAAAWTIVRRESDLDDIVADVFIGLWFSSERFDPRKGSLVGFLRMAARGRSIDFLRTSASRERREVGAAREESDQIPRLDEALLQSESAEITSRRVVSLGD
jgi:RNA polymerase sigma factor (sigma-70 family)